MKILVTGGAGFIGVNFVYYMLEKYADYDIVCLDALTYAGNLKSLDKAMENPRFTFVRGSIADKDCVDKLFEKEKFDVVINFAAESHVDRSIRNPEVFVQTNVLGTAVMLNCAKAAWELPDGTFKEGKKFLHVSTDEVFGALDFDSPLFTEETKYDPHSPYSASKASTMMSFIFILSGIMLFIKTVMYCPTLASRSSLSLSLISLRFILPLKVFGSSLTYSIILGYL